jgi:hypothetical protein
MRPDLFCGEVQHAHIEQQHEVGRLEQPVGEIV